MAAKFKSNRTTNDVTVQNNSNQVRISDKIEMLKLGDKAVDYRLRLFGPIVSRAVHAIPFVSKAGKKFDLKKQCLNYSSETQEFEDNKCPYCAKMEKSPTIYFYSNVIVRQEQDSQPRKLPEHTKSEKKTGFKEKDSKSWTPVRVFRMTSGLVGKLKKKGEKNVVKGKVYPFSDEKYGRDFDYTFDPKAAGSGMHDISFEDTAREPLSEEDKELLAWDIESAINVELEDYKEAKSQADRLCKNVEKEDDEDYASDGDSKPKSKAKPAKGKKAKPESEEVEDDSDDDFGSSKNKKGKAVSSDDDSDESEEEKPKSKSKGKKKAVSSDDFESEEEKPKAKKGKAKPASDESDDNGFSDADNSDSEEEEPKSKGKKSKAVSSEDDFESEEEKPKAKAKGKKKAASDSDGGLSDLDDDSEEEKPKSKSKGKKKAVSSDDFDSDE